ncbi:MAG TPA: hypothetical protein VLA84_04595 [Microcoleus sp.]|nr:hypothetical protein [Microcoleus sp.]
MSRCLAGDEPGLADYLPLNKGTTNTVCDKTQNANHGTIHGATWELSEVPVFAEVIETQEIVTMTNAKAIRANRKEKHSVLPTYQIGLGHSIGSDELT